MLEGPRTIDRPRGNELAVSGLIREKLLNLMHRDSTVRRRGRLWHHHGTLDHFIPALAVILHRLDQLIRHNSVVVRAPLRGERLLACVVSNGFCVDEKWCVRITP